MAGYQHGCVCVKPSCWLLGKSGCKLDTHNGALLYAFGYDFQGLFHQEMFPHILRTCTLCLPLKQQTFAQGQKNYFWERSWQISYRQNHNPLTSPRPLHLVQHPVHHQPLSIRCAVSHPAYLSVAETCQCGRTCGPSSRKHAERLAGR